MADEVEFQGIIYKSRQDRNAALALAWMTAKGTNTVAEIDEYISSDATPEMAATDCIAAWELIDESGSPKPDQTAAILTREEILEAFRSFWEERPDRMMKPEPLSTQPA